MKLQQRFAEAPPGAVLDGRDIGTVVCPNATVKMFVTASPEARARRRTDELLSKGEVADYKSILADLKRRDERDSQRTVARSAGSAASRSASPLTCRVLASQNRNVSPTRCGTVWL